MFVYVRRLQNVQYSSQGVFYEYFETLLVTQTTDIIDVMNASISIGILIIATHKSTDIRNTRWPFEEITNPCVTSNLYCTLYHCKFEFNRILLIITTTHANARSGFSQEMRGSLHINGAIDRTVCGPKRPHCISNIIRS